MGVAENGIKHQVGTKLILASDFLTFSSLLQQALFFFFLSQHLVPVVHSDPIHVYIQWLLQNQN